MPVGKGGRPALADADLDAASRWFFGEGLSARRERARRFLSHCAPEARARRPAAPQMTLSHETCAALSTEKLNSIAILAAL